MKYAPLDPVYKGKVLDQTRVNAMDTGDLLEGDAPAAKKARTVRLEHFTCKYDPAWNYEEIAEEMFDGGRYLVMLEKLSTNAHVHFQGETTLAERTFQNKRQELSAQHFIRKLKPSARPVKGVSRAVTEEGFQYICKEKTEPLAVKGFTEEELEVLRAGSERHVQDMKFRLRDYIKDYEIKAQEFYGDDHDHSRLFYRMLLEADKQLQCMGKDPSRYTKRDVANGLREHPHCTESMILWLYKNNMF